MRPSILRLEYFQAAGQAELYVAWKSPDFALTPLSRWIHPNAQSGAAKKKPDVAAGMPLTVSNEPIIYRNFITGAGTRGIGVGYPGGFNLAWSAGEMNLAMLWRGGFIDAARHWRDRGGGPQPQLGHGVVRIYTDAVPAFATPGGAEWPKLRKGGRPADFHWKGYTLDAKRMPTFFYDWKTLKIAERYDPAGGEAGQFIRTLRLTGSIPAGAMFCAAMGAKIEPQEVASWWMAGSCRSAARASRIAFW